MCSRVVVRPSGFRVSQVGFVQILRPTQYLRHEQYGLGVVTSSNTERTTIEFDLHGTKMFSTSLMVVELLRGEAPAKPAPQKRRNKTTSASAAAKPKAASR